MHFEYTKHEGIAFGYVLKYSFYRLKVFSGKRTPPNQVHRYMLYVIHVCIRIDTSRYTLIQIHVPNFKISSVLDIG